jgi:SAM-dependent methyltransferase
VTDRERLRATFEEVAELYERARPGYPAELYGDLEQLAGLSPGSRILEIGCGTGQATRDLIRRGYDVTCVELGPNLAEVARRAVPEAEIVVSSFEEWDPGSRRFDLVFAATSWHWIDPELRYAKAAAVAETLAVVATRHVSSGNDDRLYVDLQDAYVEAGEERIDLPHPDDVPDDRAEIEASGLFGDVAVRRYVVAHDYAIDDYVAVLETYSGHRAMEPAARERLYASIRRIAGDRPMRKHYLFLLHVARRTPLAGGRSRRATPGSAAA